MLEEPLAGPYAKHNHLALSEHLQVWPHPKNLFLINYHELTGLLGISETR